MTRYSGILLLLSALLIVWGLVYGRVMKPQRAIATTAVIVNLIRSIVGGV